jgi:hypothetical protein
MSSPSIETCADSGCESFNEAEIDSVLRQYEDAVKQESHLIFATSHYLKSNSLTAFICGLSAARAFEPAVMLINPLGGSRCNISFSVIEWNSFIEILQYHLHEVCDETPIRFAKYIDCGQNIQLTLFSNENVNMVSIAGNDMNLFFTSEDVYEILYTSSLISSRLFLLNNLKFATYYSNFLDLVNRLCDEANIVNVENFIYAFCDISCSIESYCIRECMHYNKYKVLSDLDSRRNIITSNM